MMKSISHSFSSRLLLGIFSIALLLLFTSLYYTFAHTKRLMLEHLKSSEKQTLLHIAKNIELDMKQLSNEMEFLSRLSVMNDIISEDMDKQILHLLEAKKSSIKFEIDFKIKANNSKELVSTTTTSFNPKKGLLFEKEITSLFQAQESLGLLQLYLPLKELNLYLQEHPSFSIYLNRDEHLKNENELYYLNEEIVLSTGQKLIIVRPILKEELSVQLIPLKRNLILLGFFILIFIFILAYFISLRISKPILDLSELMKEVSSQENYALRSKLERKDEIGVLSHSFNELLDIIEQHIEHIQSESADRMQQFTDLVESFSKITQQRSKEGINEVLNEVKLLSKEHQVPSRSFLSSLETLAGLQHERIKLEETQIKLLEEATHLAKGRSDFITQISHEFKTPLNSIIGFSQVIEHEKLLLPPYDKMARNIEKSGQHLLLLVNKVLNVANQNSMSETLVLSNFVLNELIVEVIETLEPQANKMSIAISFTAFSTSEIYTDERMFKQVLINLIANAIKFSNHKDISIELKKENAKVSIHIIDQGIGMNQHAIKKLFVPFVRLANAVEVKGTGLGLALAQSYMRKLGGKIEAKSAGMYQGSEFIIKVNG